MKFKVGDKVRDEDFEYDDIGTVTEVTDHNISVLYQETEGVVINYGEDSSSSGSLEDLTLVTPLEQLL